MAYLDFSNKRYSKSDLENLRAMLVKLNPSTLIPEEAGSITMDQFQEWLEEAVRNYASENRETLKGDTGAAGATGATGVGVRSINNYYAATNTNISPTLSEITSPTIPTMSSYNKYLWKKEVITFTDNTETSSISLACVYGDTGSQGATGATGPRGPQGAAGTNGVDGNSAYIHIKYAESINEVTGIPNDEDMTDAPSTYIGIYSDSSVLASDSASSYTWTKIKGEDGADGRGINIKASAEDCVEIGDSYVRPSDGHLMILTELPDTFEDAGQFKGDKGDTGATGAKGDKGDKGDAGDDGTDAIQYYYHVVYVDDTSTGSGYDVVPSNQLYIGTYVDTVSMDAVDWTTAQTKNIKWNYAKGATGDTGPQGDKGDKGDTGATGATGAKGDKGDKGDQGDPGQDGADGKAGDYTEYQFARSDDPNTAPTTGWQDGPPTTGGQYLWCRERRVTF